MRYTLISHPISYHTQCVPRLLTCTGVSIGSGGLLGIGWAGCTQMIQGRLRDRCETQRVGEVSTTRHQFCLAQTSIWLDSLPQNTTYMYMYNVMHIELQQHNSC